MSTLTKSTIEGQEFLSRLYSSAWFAEDSKQKIYVRWYSMPIEPKDDFYFPGIDEDDVEYAGTVFKVVAAHISEQKYLSHIPWLVRSLGEDLKLFVEKIGRLMPETDYIIVTTPIQGDGDRCYEDASEKMDGFVGMLRIVGGNNLLYELVREGSCDVATGMTQSFSKIVQKPSDCEGPFAVVERWQHFEEIRGALTDSPKKDRIELSAQLIERAFLARGVSKFFGYWVALEVAAGTHSTGKMISLLAGAYKENRAYVQNELGFDLIKATRTAVFHNGEHYELPPDVERYFQCLFLDIVRFQLGLVCRKYMASTFDDGFDVQRLDRFVGKPNVCTISQETLDAVGPRRRHDTLGNAK